MKRNKQSIAAERNYTVERQKNEPVSSYFGELTFNRKVMRDKLPKDIYTKLVAAIDEGETLDLNTANAVAHAMKEWAIDNGATHFAHWFQPMTGSTASKHDAFVEPVDDGRVVERFSGSQLVQGEPDASSFPSGGIRATFEARGYTGWDISSPVFLKKTGIGTTLYIPTAFISYTGEALDEKTPLLRSNRAVNKSALRILKLLGNTASRKVYSTCGPEQEYFLIDKDFFYKRQDLTLAGRTLIGAPPAKGQELEDQYFGSIKERVLSYMHEVEEKLYQLGYPAKTRHNEVAPSQFEIAPIFEEANVAADHNQLLMDTLRSVAKHHNFAALLHEKPFAGINGSGKHLNWSLSTNDGINLLNPGDTPHENIQFLAFLISTIRAVYYNADILRASVAHSGNDHRLGANEAPPAIISVFLGEQLTKILQDIENGAISAATDKAIIDLGIAAVPLLNKDNTDRNRTSPFAFTGNKFEFRAVGSSQSIAWPATVLNTIVAESLDIIADKIEAKGGDIKTALIDVIKDEIKELKKVLFNGDNYTEEWQQEAAKRKLPNAKTTPEALKALESSKAFDLFEKYEVLSKVELKSRHTISLEKYITEIKIEIKALRNIVDTQIIPAGLKYQKEIAKSLAAAGGVIKNSPFLDAQKELLEKISGLVGGLIAGTRDLGKLYDEGSAIEDEQAQGEFFCSKAKSKMDEIRKLADELEYYVDDDLWEIPKFWEMLFIS
ncbi:MAG: glutamine synthetase III [Spirochaetia bacterium]|jgi:glutamine synthetase|nr:glutamine synthetase III [Spirochaetia bacterium]